MSGRPARQRAPDCPYCGQPLELKAVAYQPVATPEWDFQLERSRLILETLTETEREVN